MNFQLCRQIFRELRGRGQVQISFLVKAFTTEVKKPSLPMEQKDKQQSQY